MDIEEFIKTSLCQIISGVEKAQASVGKDLVNPSIMYGGDSAPKGKYYATVSRNLVHFVDFDIAVSADTTKEGKGGASVKLAVFSADAGGGTSNSNSVVSRLKFQIPITLPKPNGSE